MISKQPKHTRALTSFGIFLDVVRISLDFPKRPDRDFVDSFHSFTMSDISWAPYDCPYIPTSPKHDPSEPFTQIRDGPAQGTDDELVKELVHLANEFADDENFPHLGALEDFFELYNKKECEYNWITQIHCHEALVKQLKKPAEVFMMAAEEECWTLATFILDNHDIDRSKITETLTDYPHVLADDQYHLLLQEHSIEIDSNTDCEECKRLLQKRKEEEEYQAQKIAKKQRSK